MPAATPTTPEGSTPRAARFARGAAALLLVTAVACDHNPTAPGGGGLALARRLMTGETTACALDGAGAVRCWGFSSTFWEYGASPGAIQGGYGVSAAAVPALASLARGNGPHSCGISSAGAAICWARGGAGQLGRGFVEPGGNEAAEVVGGLSWSRISVGRLITCGITTTGAGYCWGLDQRGEVGNGDTLLGVRVTAPYSLGDSLTWKSIAAGWLHACGVTTDGTAYCWGGNDQGQLGIGAPDTLRRGPTKVSGNLTFAQVSAGSKYTCGITTGGAAYCWGANVTGQRGDGTTDAAGVPTPVSGGHHFIDIATSSGFSDGAVTTSPGAVGTFGHTCALDVGGGAWCWGWNGSGELGDGTRIDRPVPVAVQGNVVFDALGAGSAFTCGMRGAYAWCWGSNIDGQLGAGISDFMAFAPIPVAAPFRAP